MKIKNLFYITLFLLILTGCKFTSKPQKAPFKYELVTINCTVPEYEPASNRSLVVPTTLTTNDITQFVFSGEFIFEDGYSLNDLSDEEKQYFSFTKTYETVNEQTAYYNLSTANFTIAKGNWNFTLEAKTKLPDNTLQTAAIGKNNNISVTDSSAGIPFTMEKVNSGDGCYSAKIDFPWLGADVVKCIVLRTDESSEGKTPSEITHTNDDISSKSYFTIDETQISSGLYYLYIFFFKNETLISVNTIYFQVAPGHKTNIEQKYTEINTPYTITYVLKLDSDTDTTNIPKWENNSTNVTYSFNSSMNITLPDENDITRDNYIFEGWYTDSALTEEPVTGWSAGEKKADVTLYAKWTPIRKASGKIKPSIHENIKFSLSTEIVSLDGETIDIKVSKDGQKLSSNDLTNLKVAVSLYNEEIFNSDDSYTNSYVSLETPEGSLPKLNFKRDNYPRDYIVTVSAEYGAQVYSANLAVSSRMCYEYQNSRDLANIQADSEEIYVKVRGENVPASNELNALTGKIILDLSQCEKTNYSPYFSECETLKKIILPDGVTSIGNYAFEGCTGLTSIEIPDSVTSIGMNAFDRCSSLKSIEIPDSVTSIGNYAFRYCSNLTSIKIPDSVTSIQDCTFSGCSGLTSIEIPDSVKSIGGSTFYNCTSLTSIKIPDSVTSIGGSTFYNCTSLKSIEIPDSVTSIGDYVFYGCSDLTSIKIPDSVTSIGRSTFYNCTSLTSIEIPDSVTSIGDYAFSSCSGLTSIKIGDSVTSIGNNAFYNCTSLTSIEIGDSVTSIGNYAFENCTGLKSIEIPDSVTSIGNYAFGRCTGLKSIEIPDSVTSIGNYAFRYCSNLTSIKIPDSVTSIQDCTFYGCSGLTSIEIPDSVKSIGASTFYNCTSLTSIKIPDSVTSIEGYAFRYCSNLTSIKIPDSVTSIRSDAFSGCSNLSSVTVEENQTWTVNGKTIELKKDTPADNAMNLKNYYSYSWTRQL